MTETWKPRVLIVDDEDAIRTALSAALEAEGWQVDEAPGGARALAWSTTHYYDAVVLDLRMPGISGIEVARELLLRGFSGALLLFSAYVDTGVRQACEKLGMLVVDKADWRGLLDACREVAGACAPA